ncbi:nicotinate-nicotinamide nucleotide adenylyltransferase [bacterium]|nr:nicotinate-nicotinamide nucleotide adenylyltransferase [bacterium]
MRSIAIFGGSFNPPHIGHQMMLAYLSWLGRFDKIWVNPVYHHYFQKDKLLIDFEKRFEMAKIAFEKISPTIEINPIDRENQFSKTFDAVVFLKERYPDDNFTLILGEDNYLSKDRWYRFSDVEKMVSILYLGREGVESELKLPFKFPSISSTKVRESIEESKELLDYDVYSYIKKNQLY